MTNSQIRDTLLCQSREKLKVVKWCQKRWNWPILMYIYHKQCEIIQKIQWKGSNSQLQCFYNGRLLTDRSSLLKTPETRETKTRITQNFELVWPIQGRTMWKLTSWGFRKCGSFRDFEVLNRSYGCLKSVDPVSCPSEKLFFGQFFAENCFSRPNRSLSTI